MTVEKLEVNGKIAVMISPGFGAGWSSWNLAYREVLLFDKEIATLFFEGREKAAYRRAEEKCPGMYIGSGGVELVWLPKGTRFILNEFDGNEEIITELAFNLTA
jgi:hypothetical protein